MYALQTNSHAFTAAPTDARARDAALVERRAP
jgi:hypothetical protein